MFENYTYIDTIFTERRILIRKGSKSLYDYCQENPDKLYLLEEWDYEKNEELGLTPENVSYGSKLKVWWLLPYDDPKTGKHFDFEWDATIYSRSNGCNCPYLSNQAVWQGYNDLASQRPNLAAEWHPTQNGDLKPAEVSVGSKQKVWWLCPYCNNIWNSAISNRIRGGSCPRCREAGTSLPELYLYYYLKKIYPDTLHRHKIQNIEFDIYIPTLNLAIEYDCSYWHKNKINKENKKDQLCKDNNIRFIRLRDLSLPKTNTAEIIWFNDNSDKNISKGIVSLFEYLKIEYNFKIDLSHDYKDIVGIKLLKEKENNLTITHPDLCREWHPTKNGIFTPNKFTYGSHSKVWWLLPYDDPITGKHFDFEWEATIANRVYGNGCPYLSNQAIWQGYNDLATINPDLAAEWHPTKNILKSTEVPAVGSQKVWWLLPYDDPITGKHFDFEWEATIANRVYGNGCPYLSNQAIWQGFNDLATTHPDLCKEWHPTKNSDLKPTEVTAGSGKKVWWQCSKGHEWQASLKSRSSGNGCPCCSKKWTEEDINIMMNYYESEGIKIKNRLSNKSEKSIIAKANKLGLKRQRNTDNNE